MGPVFSATKAVAALGKEVIMFFVHYAAIIVI